MVPVAPDSATNIPKARPIEGDEERAQSPTANLCEVPRIKDYMTGICLSGPQGRLALLKPARRRKRPGGRIAVSSATGDLSGPGGPVASGGLTRASALRRREAWTLLQIGTFQSQRCAREAPALGLVPRKNHLQRCLVTVAARPAWHGDELLELIYSQCKGSLTALASVRAGQSIASRINYPC